MVSVRQSCRCAGLLALLAGAGCRDTPTTSGASSSQETAKPTPRTLRNAPCNSAPIGTLDAPLRHEKWASAPDVARIQAAASRINANRKRLDGEPRLELLSHRDAVSSAEGALNIANNTVEQSCLKFIDSYSELQDAVLTTSQVSGTNARLETATEALMTEIECWSVTTDRRTGIDRIARKVTALDGGTHGSQSNSEAAVSALRERWAIFDVALRDRESAREKYVQAAVEMATVAGKAATRAGLKPAERDVLLAAFEALPKVYLVTQQLHFIAEYAATMADKNQVVQPSNLMCWTLSLLESPSLIAPDETTVPPAELAKQWQVRLDAVHGIIDQALAVPGAEW